MRQLFRMAAVLVALCATRAACAQDQGAASSAAARRDQFAKVQEQLADPDPLMRLANMEAIVDSGDALEIDLALRAAFSSDDSELRALAMRAYMASLQQLDFDVKLPPTVQPQYDAAVGDGSKMTELVRRYPYVRVATVTDFRFRLVLKDYSIKETKGTILAWREAPFVISGDRFLARATFDMAGVVLCDVEFRPSRTLTLEGMLWCANFGVGAPRLAISAKMF